MKSTFYEYSSEQNMPAKHTIIFNQSNKQHILLYFKKFAEVDPRLAQIWFGMAILWNFVCNNIAETENLHRNHFIHDINLFYTHRQIFRCSLLNCVTLRVSFDLHLGM